MPMSILQCTLSTTRNVNATQRTKPSIMSPPWRQYVVLLGCFNINITRVITRDPPTKEKKKKTRDLGDLRFDVNQHCCSGGGDGGGGDDGDDVQRNGNNNKTISKSNSNSFDPPQWRRNISSAPAFKQQKNGRDKSCHIYEHDNRWAVSNIRIQRTRRKTKKK